MDKRDTVLAKLALGLGLINGPGLQRAMALAASHPGTSFDRLLLERGLIDADGWKRLVGAFNEQVRAARGGAPAPPGPTPTPAGATPPAPAPAPRLSPPAPAPQAAPPAAARGAAPAGRPGPAGPPIAARGVALRRPSPGPSRRPALPGAPRAEAPPPAPTPAAAPADAPPAWLAGAPSPWPTQGAPGWPQGAPPPGWPQGAPPPGWPQGVPPPGWPHGAPPPGWPVPGGGTPPGWAPPPGWPPGAPPPAWPPQPAGAAPPPGPEAGWSPASWVAAPPPGWTPFAPAPPADSDEEDLALPPEDEPNLVIPVEDAEVGLGASDDVLDPVGSPLQLPAEDDEGVFGEPTIVVADDETSAPDADTTDEGVFSEPTMIIQADAAHEGPPTRPRGPSASSVSRRPDDEATVAASHSGMGSVDDAPTAADEEVFAEPTIVLTDASGVKRSRPTETPSDEVYAEPTIVLAEGAGNQASAPPAPGEMAIDVSLASSGRRKAPAAAGEPMGDLGRDEFQRRLKAKQDFKGFTLGDYKVVSELSRGAFGVVLEVEPGGAAKQIARQRGMEGNLALKVMLENATDPREKERFLDEVRVLIGLDHPHIVKIFDAGGFGGLRFYAMELVKGTETRAHVKKNGPMPPLLVVRVVKEVASALSYVHAQKIYHRDLKPQNVMLDMACQPYRSLLIDFGLVSEQQGGGPDKDKGLIMGTPNYMPPEQASPKGGFGEVDHSSDIYSLGATMYYLLTGEPPFTGRDPRLIIKQVVSEKPRDPCELNKSIPRRIADICLKCLEKRQADRFPSSRALEAELDKELRSGQRTLKAKAFLGKLLGRPRDKDGK